MFQALLRNLLNLKYSQVSVIHACFLTNETFSLLSLSHEPRLLLNCHNKDYQPYTEQRGDFWVLKNYVRAEHGELKCFETITYTTHADYTFLDNLIPLLER